MASHDQHLYEEKNENDEREEHVIVSSDHSGIQTDDRMTVHKSANTWESSVNLTLSVHTSCFVFPVKVQ